MNISQERHFKDFANDCQQVFLKRISKGFFIIMISLNLLIFFMKKSNIIVGEAPDPENIQWDNFEYSGKDKFLRRIFSYILTFLLLVISKLFLKTNFIF